LKSGPKKGFYTGSQGRNIKKKKKKSFQSAPKLLINAELYDLVLTPSLEKKRKKYAIMEFGKPILQPLGGPMFQHLCALPCLGRQGYCVEIHYRVY
jgi:hypothetical protein